MWVSNQGILVNNIRILQKIKLNINQIEPSINIFLPEVRSKIIKEIIFITVAKLDPQFHIKLERLEALSDFYGLLPDTSEEGKKLYLDAARLGYTDSVISQEIIHLNNTGICNYEVIKNAGQKLDETETSYQVGMKLEKAYEPYFESFQPCEKALKISLIEFLEQNSSLLTFQQLQGMTEIAKTIELDMETYCGEWVKNQLEISKSPENIYHLRLLVHDSDIFSISSKILLLNEIEKKINDLIKDIDVNSILLGILKKKSWSPHEITYLNSLTLDEWEQWLLQSDPQKVFMIRKGLGMSEEFSQRLKEAITKLAYISDFNKIRAKNLYGVDTLNN